MADPTVAACPAGNEASAPHENDRRGNQLNVETVVNHLGKSTVGMQDLEGRDVILVVGATRVGKTVFTHILCKRGMLVKKIPIVVEGLEGVMVEDGTGELYTDMTELVIDTENPLDGTKIGHSNDAETFVASGFPIPGTSCFVCDPPGFGDTRAAGTNLDAANAIVLNNIARKASKLWPVLLLKTQSLGEPGYMKEQMGIFRRFFNPVEDYLPNLAVFMSRPTNLDDPPAVLRALAKLLSADHVKADNDLRAFIKHTLDRVLFLQTDVFVRPTRPDASDVYLKTILDQPPIDVNRLTGLGFPLTSEAQHHLQMAVTARAGQLASFLSNRQYAGAMDALDSLGCLKDHINLPLVARAYADAIKAADDHVLSMRDESLQAMTVNKWDQVADHLKSLESLVPSASRLTNLRDTHRRLLEQSSNQLSLLSTTLGSVANKPLDASHVSALRVVTLMAAHVDRHLDGKAAALVQKCSDELAKRAALVHGDLEMRISEMQDALSACQVSETPEREVPTNKKARKKKRQKEAKKAEKAQATGGVNAMDRIHTDAVVIDPNGLQSCVELIEEFGTIRAFVDVLDATVGDRYSDTTARFSDILLGFAAAYKQIFDELDTCKPASAGLLNGRMSSMLHWCKAAASVDMTSSALSGCVTGSTKQPSFESASGRLRQWANRLLQPVYEMGQEDLASAAPLIEAVQMICTGQELTRRLLDDALQNAVSHVCSSTDAFLKTVSALVVQRKYSSAADTSEYERIAVMLHKTKALQRLDCVLSDSRGPRDSFVSVCQMLVGDLQSEADHRVDAVSQLLSQGNYSRDCEIALQKLDATYAIQEHLLRPIDPSWILTGVEQVLTRLRNATQPREKAEPIAIFEDINALEQLLQDATVCARAVGPQLQVMQILRADRADEAASELTLAIQTHCATLVHMCRAHLTRQEAAAKEALSGRQARDLSSGLNALKDWGALDPFLDREPSQVYTRVQQQTLNGVWVIVEKCRRMAINLGRTQDLDNVFANLRSYLQDCLEHLTQHLPDIALWHQSLLDDIEASTAGAQDNIKQALEQKRFSKASRYLRALKASDRSTREEQVRFQRAVDAVEDAIRSFEADVEEECSDADEQLQHAEPTAATVSNAKTRLKIAREMLDFDGLVDFNVSLLFQAVWDRTLAQAKSIQQQTIHLLSDKQMKFPAASQLFHLCHSFAALDKMAEGQREDVRVCPETFKSLYEVLPGKVKEIPAKLAASLQTALEEADEDDVKISRIFNACRKAAESQFQLFSSSGLDLDFEEVLVNLKRQFRKFCSEVFDKGSVHAVAGQVDLAERRFQQLRILAAIATEITGLRSPESDLKRLEEDIAVRRGDLTYRAFASHSAEDLQRCLAELSALAPKPFKDASDELLDGARQILQPISGVVLSPDYDLKRNWNSSVGAFHRFQTEAHKLPGCTHDLHRLAEKIHDIEGHAKAAFLRAVDKVQRHYFDLHDRDCLKAALRACQTLGARVKGCVPPLEVPQLADHEQRFHAKVQEEEEIRHRVQQYTITKPMDMEELRVYLTKLRRSSTGAAYANIESAPRSLEASGATDAYEDVLDTLCDEARSSRNRVAGLLDADNVGIIAVIIKNIENLGDTSMSAFKRLAKAASEVLPGLRDELTDFRRTLLSKMGAALQSSDYDQANAAYERLRKYVPDLLDCQEEVIDAVQRVAQAHWTPVARDLSMLTSEDGVHRVADSLVRIEQCRSAIKDQDIRDAVKKTVEECIESVHAQLKNGGMMQLAHELQDMGADEGAAILGYAARFGSIRAERRLEATSHVTFDHAIKLMKDAPGIALDVLVKLHKRYERSFNAKVQQAEFGWTAKTLEADIAAVKDDVRAIIPRSGRSTDIRIKLASVLGKISFIWAAKQSLESNQQTIRLRPHAVQVIAMFVLLGLAENSEGALQWVGRKFGVSSGPDVASLPGSLAQLGTGEGKSIVLGLVSLTLALLGYDVASVCYNDTLSNRDRNAFYPLFTAFGMEDHITYSTLRELADTTINRNGSVRDLGKQVLLGRRGKGGSKKRKERPQVLLIDEVDVFFSDSFLGVTYNPIERVHSKETVSLFKWVWNHRKEHPSMSDVKERVEYQSLVESIGHHAEAFINNELKQILRDVQSLGSHRYKVVGQSIGYEEHGTISTSTYNGYLTAFAYLQEAERGNISSHSADIQLGLQIDTGNFSYADIPRGSRIVGVSGTLSDLTEEERKMLSDEYNIKQFVPLPSIYGESKLMFPSKSPQGIVCEPDIDRFHQKILQECKDERADKERAVLVFFDTEDHLEEFRTSDYGKRLDSSLTQVITEVLETRDLEYHIQQATKAGMVTLSTRAFGRGTDFQCDNPAVIQNGGVHVIQTFFSMEAAEEVQIKGRTARQRNSGSFQLILLLDRLTRTARVSKEQVAQAQAENSLYAMLSEKRAEVQSARIQTLRSGMTNARKRHEESEAFVEAARDPERASEAFAMLMKLNGV